MAAKYAAAWGSQSAEGVASFYAPDGKIAINGGDEIAGRAAIADMATGFYAEFPDLIVHLDDIRAAGNQAIFVWTLEGTHAGTGNRVKVQGWEELTLSDDCLVASSFGRFDAAECDRQMAEGI
jgi:uncharacterized protein (TIGR02246 family)